MKPLASVTGVFLTSASTKARVSTGRLQRRLTMVTEGIQAMTATSQTSRRQYESPAVAATRVGMSSETVYRWIASGQLSAYRIGTHLLRVDPDELDRMMTLVSRDASPVSARRARRSVS